MVVTGSSGGIGRETARVFAAGGADVVIHGRNGEKLEAVRSSLCELGANVRVVAGDISDPQTSTSLAEAAEALGGCSVLVNNAGMSMRGAFTEISPEVFSRVCETNITGSALATQALLPALRQTKGSVIFVSSVAGMTGFPGVSIYAAAKMALSGLAESLRGELRGTGVHVGVVHPGFTENDPDKRILAADGSALSLSRPYDMTQAEVARHIERMVRRRTEIRVLTRKGRLLRLMKRISPRVTSAIIRRSGGNIHGVASRK